jgi:CheY-like chemotaxis protein
LRTANALLVSAGKLNERPEVVIYITCFMSNDPLAAPAKKILVVDDNEIVVKTLSLKLQGAGYQVITAADGAEGVAAVRKEIPDLILLDVFFPPDVGGVPWDGFRIMEWFHRLDSAKKIPIIIITGSEDPHTKERATTAGAIAYFQKPLEHDYLLKVIRATLGEAVKP